MGDEIPVELHFGTKKKKKNKNSVAPTHSTEEFQAANTETTGNPHTVADITDDLGSLDFGEKKKKKKIPPRTFEEDSASPSQTAVEDAVGLSGETGENVDPQDASLAAPAYKGYTYDELLDRVFRQIQAKNPDHMSETKKRLVMAPPSMARVGTKKTHFTNFNQICKSLNRDPAHLCQYLFAELGTTGSVDANGALLIRGKYLSKHIEPVLRNYARNYVLCSTCNSPETVLSKDSRLLFLECTRCGSRLTVKNVTAGFQAVTGKRAALRAKTQ